MFNKMDLFESKIGNYIYRQNQKSKFLYFIKQGEVQVIRSVVSIGQRSS